MLAQRLSAGERHERRWPAQCGPDPSAVTGITRARQPPPELAADFPATSSRHSGHGRRSLVAVCRDGAAQPGTDGIITSDPGETRHALRPRRPDAAPLARLPHHQHRLTARRKAVMPSDLKAWTSASASLSRTTPGWQICVRTALGGAGAGPGARAAIAALNADSPDELEKITIKTADAPGRRGVRPAVQDDVRALRLSHACPQAEYAPGTSMSRPSECSAGVRPGIRPARLAGTLIIAVPKVTLLVLRRRAGASIARSDQEHEPGTRQPQTKQGRPGRLKTARRVRERPGTALASRS